MASADAGQGAAQPAAAKRFVILVTVAGAIALGASLPLAFPRPALFFVLLAASCVTSAWKINLPIPLASGSTLSVSYAADLMALVLLGPKPALVIAVAGAWTQCTYRVRKRYPIYRSAFSAASEALTTAATGAEHVQLARSICALDFTTLAGPVGGTAASYFFV